MSALRRASTWVLLALAGCSGGGGPDARDAAAEQCPLLVEEEPEFMPVTKLWPVDYVENSGQSGAWVSSSSRDGLLRLGVQRSARTFGLALRADGTAVVQQDMTGGSLGVLQWGDWTAAAITRSFDGGRYEESHGPLLRWRDMRNGQDLVRFDVEERWGCWPWGVLPRARVVIAQDRALWVFRRTDYPLTRTRCEGLRSPEVLHIWNRDGEELLPEQGVPLEQPHVPFTLAAAEDGSVWYLVLTPAGGSTEEEPRFELQAVRRGPEGEVASSTVLAGPERVPLRKPVENVLRISPWAETTDDGAYLVHYVGLGEPSIEAVSYVARIEPDGTLAWQRSSRFGATAGWPVSRGGPQVAVDEQDGGVVAVVAPSAARERMWLWKVDACGRQPWGEGIRIYEDAMTIYGNPAEVNDLVVASAPDGGVFVVRRVVGLYTYAERFDAAGRAQWEPEGNGVLLDDHSISSRRRSEEPIASLVAVSDGSGGVWIVNRRNVDAEIQHLDAEGRALFRRHRWTCEEDGDFVRSERVQVERDGGIAGIDAGTPPDAMCPPADAGMDGSLGMDASQDAAAEAAAGGDAAAGDAPGGGPG